MPERILIIDDDVDTLRLVGLMLQRQGYGILAANHGKRGMELARQEKPDLILLDVMMPDIDGFEILRRLRADPETESIPVIMFTAKTQIDDKVTGFELGADDYLTKPVHPTELIAHVKSLLARYRKLRQQEVAAVDSRKQGKVIGLLAAKGGLGVTTLALNLAVTLRQKHDLGVMLTDFRPGQGTLGLILGYTHPKGLNNLLEKAGDGVRTQDIEMQLVMHASGVKMLLASPQPADARYTAQPASFEAIARQLAYLADYVLVDLGAGLPPVTQAVLPFCHHVLVSVEPVPATVAQTRLLLQDLEDLGFGQTRVDVVLVNRIRSSVQLGWTKVQEMLERPIVTVFSPAPELTFQAENMHTPVVIKQPDSLTAQQFAKLADVLVHQR